MTVILIFALITAISMPRRANASDSSIPSVGTLRIFGEVNRPLNLTYDELLSFPMVSEVAELKCVDGYPDVIGNWTGIPLFYLLTLAQINSDAYKIVTEGSDGYSSDLLLVDALRPTTILALKDNGTTSASGIEPLPRLIVPNNWGYKWVAEVDSIDVVNYNYQGTWESSGYSDNGTRPGLTVLPSITPPVQQLNFSYGNLKFNVQAFTNASISTYAFNYSQKQMSLNATVPPGTVGFVDFELPQDFLKSPYNVTIDNHVVNITEADLANQSYVYAPLPEGFHSVSIVGRGIFGLAPEINLIRPQNIYVGENVIFDASKSIANGTIILYEWSFGDGTNGTGAVVSHSYDREGTYQMELNVTDNYGLRTSEMFTITVGTPQYVPLALEAVLAMMLILLILMFAVLMRSRGKDGTASSRDLPAEQSSDQVTQIKVSLVCTLRCRVFNRMKIFPESN
jgi:hypothetical protein